MFEIYRLFTNPCRFVLLCFFSAFGFSSFSANYQKLVEKGAYEKMEKELENDRSKITTQEDYYNYNFWRSVMLMHPAYKKQDATKAYNILINLQKKFISMNEQDIKERIIKNGITNDLLLAYTDSACYFGLLAAQKVGTYEAYNGYYKTFELARSKYRDTARCRRDALAYEIAKRKNTEDAYSRFISAYPYALQVDEAKQKIVDLNFSEALNLGTTKGYAMFLSKFPDSNHSDQIRDSLYKSAFFDVCKIDHVDFYAQYKEQYPRSPYLHSVDSLMQDKSYDDFIVPNSWNSYVTFLSVFPQNAKYRGTALDSLLAISLRQKSAKGLLYYLDNAPQTANRNELAKKLYQWMSVDGEISTLDFYSSKFPVVNASYQQDYKAAKMAQELDFKNLKVSQDNVNQVSDYIRVAGDKDLAFVALQKLIREPLKNKDWTAALTHLRRLKPMMKGNRFVSELEEVLSRPAEPNVEVKSLGATASKNGNEYYPVISADGKKLYFCGRDRDDNIGGEDVFVCEWRNGAWSKPKVFAPLSSKGSNDGMMAVSADGTQVIKFENGVMGVSTKKDKEWGEVEFFPPNINRGVWNCDATFCADGATLLFTSIRPSSSDFNQDAIYHGCNHYQSDIYVSHRDSNGFWSEPVNLGPVVNSIYSERTPYMHPDMKTLYFSSDGHGGLGGYDVYKTTRLADSCWNCWSKPVNLGREINTPDDDWTYKISTDGTTAYFSQKENETNQSNIYSINLPESQRPFNVVTISGQMVDHSGHKMVTEVVWEDLETNQIIGRAKTDPEDGKYFIALPTGKLYGIYVNDSTVYPDTRHVDLRERKEAAALSRTFHATTIEELKKGRSITINNIFFDFGKADLLKYSYPELRRLAKLLVQMNMKVEISGHTDNIGSDAANLKMSAKRAEAVKSFLVKSGCNPDNIMTQGYGSEKPIADNDTEEGRARNRRVEMRTIQ